MSATKRNGETSDREIVVSRIINAPRELVFTAWSDSKHLEQWIGPRGFTSTTESFAFKPGGVWKYIMHGPDGTDYDNKVTYREIVKPEYILYDHGGNGEEVVFQTRVTFEDLKNNTTKLTMFSIFPTADAKDYAVKNYGAIEGGQQTVERLEDYVQQTLNKSGDTAPFVITRTFKAPQDLMFKVWTEQKHFQNWFGPKGVKIKTIKFELRPGGMNHYCMITPDGKEMWGRAIYKEISPITKLVWINSFSDPQGGLGRHPLAPDWPAEMLTTVTFSQHQEFTTVKVEWIPINATQAELDMFEQGRSGMTGGWTGTFEQLEEYLKSVV